MTRRSPLAVVLAAVMMLTAAALWGGDDGHPRQLSTPTTTEPSSTTTLGEVPAALVSSGTLPLEEETELIEEATAVAAEATTTTSVPTTTTTVQTTTTAAPAPTTTEQPKEPATTTAPSTTSPPTTQAGGYDSGAESDFASRINSYRGGSGLSSLTREVSLDSYARSWAKKMAENGSLSHSNIGSLVPPWESVGENVGTGGSVGAIFDALIASGPHSSTMLGEFTHLGVGVYLDSSGTLWTAHVFTR